LSTDAALLFADACELGTPAAFDAILAVVRERTGADFTRYRLSTVTRRVCNRMISVGAVNYDDYLRLLRADEHEAQHLLERLTIKVSRFYRNAVTFDALRTGVLPALAKLRGSAPIRIWSAGCGQGEEPYTLAMLLDDAGTPGNIEATDLDPRALHAARIARYPVAALGELPTPLRARYCADDGDWITVGSEVRTRVRFSLHDLTSDAAPPGPERFDLICCRNVLIYLDRAHQERALQRLCDGLCAGGYLCLGEAEWPLPSLADRLAPLEHRTRLFRAVPAAAAWSNR
jgi:chemotaxis methyl-accepting protein methylase